MADYNEISQSIQSLRLETSPDSVTPARVAGLLQAIADLVKALSNVPEEELVSVMQSVHNAVSTANAAEAAAEQAAEDAAKMALDTVEFAASPSGLVLTIKQKKDDGNDDGFAVAVPVANSSRAGIVTPATLQDIADAMLTARNSAVNSVNVSQSTGSVSIGVTSVGGTSKSRSIAAATINKAGVMSAADKQKLQNLPNSGVVALDAAERVPAANAPICMLRNVAPTSLDDLANGDFYLDDNYHIQFQASGAEVVDMGVPSKNVVYCHVDTNVLYRWNGSAMVPLTMSASNGIEKRTVTCANRTLKRYDIPANVLTELVISTDVVNFNLLPSSTGASVHRILILEENLGTLGFDENNCMNWANTVIWANNIKPRRQDLDERTGVLVTIYDNTYASFQQYG